MKIRTLLMMVVSLVLGLIAPLSFAGQSSNGQASLYEQVQRLPWVMGPKHVTIGSNSSIEVPSGYKFLPPPSSTKFLSLNGNPDNGATYYVLSKDDYSWFSVFRYQKTGYVKDKSNITKSFVNKTYDLLVKGTNRDNVLRKKYGEAPIELKGWYIKPNYDRATHRLEWATLLSSADSRQLSVNFNTRVLGRNGVMSVVLVDSKSAIAKDIPVFNDTLKGFGFSPGNRYSDHQATDKAAEYGLMGLIAGGAAAAAVKTGVFASAIALVAGLWKGALVLVAGFWKAALVFVLAALTAVRRFFAKLFRKQQ